MPSQGGGKGVSGISEAEGTAQTGLPSGAVPVGSGCPNYITSHKFNFLGANRTNIKV